MEENRETVGCLTKMFHICSTLTLINWISVNFHFVANLLWSSLRKLRLVSGWLILTVSAVFVVVIFHRHSNIYIVSIVSINNDMLLQNIN